LTLAQLKLKVAEGAWTDEREVRGEEDDLDETMNNETYRMGPMHHNASVARKKRKRETLAEKETREARQRGQGNYGHSDINMRKFAIKLSEQGEKVPAIMNQLKQQFPNTQIPGGRAVQKWLKNKKEIKECDESNDAQMRMRKSPAAYLNAILHEQLKDFEATGEIITDKVIDQLAKRIAQEKGEEVRGRSNIRQGMHGRPHQLRKRKQLGTALASFRIDFAALAIMCMQQIMKPQFRQAFRQS
jgi:ribosomal protein L34E